MVNTVRVHVYMLNACQTQDNGQRTKGYSVLMKCNLRHMSLIRSACVFVAIIS